jgi:hypothetical protein
MAERGEMATLTELAKAIADIEGLDLANVNLIAREVREAGLITTAGRGRSAAKMNVSDAANLLIAVNVSVQIREAPEAVKSYRDLPARYQILDPRKRRWIKSGVWTFGVFLEELIESFVERSCSPTMKLYSTSRDIAAAFSRANHVLFWMRFERPEPIVSIEMFVNKPGEGNIPESLLNAALHLVFRHPSRAKRLYFFHELDPVDRKEVITISQRTLECVAALMR